MEFEEMDYKEIIKDEKSLIKYLDQLIERDDLDIKNKVYSACMAGRFFEIDKYFKQNSEQIIDKFLKGE